MKILQTIIFAFALLVLLRAGKYFLGLASRNKSYHHYTLKVFPWLEIAVWVAFIFWMVEHHFARTNIYPFVTGALTAIFLALAGWYVLRDIVYGAVIRSDYELEKGLKIKAGEISGKISATGYLSLEVISEEGEKVKVPYSRLSASQIIVQASRSSGKRQTLKALVPRKYGAHNLQKSLKRKMLEFPWVLAESDIKIELRPQDDQYLAEVSFESLKEDMLPRSEELIREFVEKNFN